MRQELKDRIHKAANDLAEDTIKLRRHFHMYPELGLEEHKTAAKVADILEHEGLEVTRGVGGTGVVALLRGNGNIDKTIGLRADMDALPVQDKKEVPYVSRIAGKMHACGHDAHTAILVGTARLLKKLQAELPGNVKFIFQPAEEGPGGAEPMIAEGVLANPELAAIFGLHVGSDEETGRVGTMAGPLTANTDEVTIRVTGKGGHASAPHKTVDAITISGQVLVAIQQIVSRMVKPQEPVVLTMGKINGGYRGNVIADEVVMEGTLRTLTDEMRKEVSVYLEEVLRGVTKAFGGDFYLAIKRGYPSVINDIELVGLLQRTVNEVAGSKAFELFNHPSLGGEDFAYFTRKVPGCFFYLGTKSGEGSGYPGHNPYFDVDESAFVPGMEIFCGLVFNYFAREKNGQG